MTPPSIRLARVARIAEILSGIGLVLVLALPGPVASARLRARPRRRILDGLLRGLEGTGLRPLERLRGMLSGAGR